MAQHPNCEMCVIECDNVEVPAVFLAPGGSVGELNPEGGWQCAGYTWHRLCHRHSIDWFLPTWAEGVGPPMVRIELKPPLRCGQCIGCLAQGGELCQYWRVQHFVGRLTQH